MHPKLLRTLNFLKLIDENASLSLSNVAMMVVLVKLALAPTVSLAEAAILLPVIGNYAFKGYHLRRSTPKVVVAPNLDAVKLETLTSEVEKLKLAFGMRSR